MKHQNLFILGNPRSGTSLFRIMMSSHKSIIVPPECGFIQWWYPKYKKWNINNSNYNDFIDSFISDLKTSKKIETWKLNYDDLKRLIKKEKPNNYSELTSLVILQYAHHQNKKPTVLGDKNNYYISHLNLLNKLYPSAKYIVIVRDSRDVVCSYLKVNELKSNSPYKPNFPNDIEAISEEWKINNERILEFTRSLNNSNFLFIKYEDLIGNPECILKKCVNFLDLQFESSMLNYYNESLEPSALIDWKMKTNQEIDKTNSGNYLKQLNAKQISKIMLVTNSLMQKFDYI